MIEAFGSFVVGGNYIIGAVIFLVLIAIQYVVINHGAVRISEVTARFTLDALPGKQMSIDADLNGGLIDETEARKRRKKLASEAEFYGAMDGASRFTQRDAIASILITGINIIAGFLIGVLQHGMELRPRARNLHRADHRRRLGDGDPRADDLDFRRLDRDPHRPPRTRSAPSSRNRCWATRSRCCWPAECWWRWRFCPGLPTIPFLLLGGGVGAMALRLRQKTDAEAAVLTAADAKAEGKSGRLAEGGAAVAGSRTGLGEPGGARPAVAASAAGGGHPQTARDAARIPAAAGQSEGQRGAALARIRDPDARHGNRAL